ncbi:YciI family protein [Marinomonas spartinae]|uniref:YciI family protein n=1 Tax=Marinomonas spartinae TaxID=1792290 RepID=UPI0018F23CC1|nr:YciI family protein [Marinomonas spartinae]MBJ7555270.1 YciI family protein [Marinomonas spartinae]
MLYSIISDDVENSLPARQQARPAHLERLQVLQNAGRLVLAGPSPAIDSDNPGDAGFTGSVVVAEFPSLEEAQKWADADPYVAAGVYQRVVVKPFKQVFPN